MFIRRPLAAMMGVPLLMTGLAGVAHSVQVTSSQDEWIPRMTAIYVGPESSAGRSPRIKVVAERVTEAFGQMVTVETVRALAQATDGKASAKGDRVSAEGFDCTARKVRVREPGTAGEFFDVSWLCRFRPADTPTRVRVSYRQSSL